MKPKVYIETSVIIYLTARPGRDLVAAARQEVTREVWPRLIAECEPYVSALVLREAARGDMDAARARASALSGIIVSPVETLAQELAAALVAARAIPEEHVEDALHIAVAAVNGMDYLVTWNYSHINNIFTRSRIRSIVESHGLRCPEICSPDHLSGDEE